MEIIINSDGVASFCYEIVYMFFWIMRSKKARLSSRSRLRLFNFNRVLPPCLHTHNLTYCEKGFELKHECHFNVRAEVSRGWDFNLKSCETFGMAGLRPMNATFMRVLQNDVIIIIEFLQELTASLRIKFKAIFIAKTSFHQKVLLQSRFWGHTCNWNHQNKMHFAWRLKSEKARGKKLLKRHWEGAPI